MSKDLDYAWFIAQYETAKQTYRAAGIHPTTELVVLSMFLLEIDRLATALEGGNK